MTESHEAATRILNDYHDRLEKAEREGRCDSRRPSRTAPPAWACTIALMLLDRLLRDPKGAIVGFRTVMTEVSA